MKRGEVITQLKSEGYAATVGRLRQALLNGYVDPPGRRGRRGAFDYRAEHLEQLRWYLVHVRPGPAPRQPDELPLTGRNDRLHRLAVKKSTDQRRRQQRRQWDRSLKQGEALLDRLRMEQLLSS